MGAICAALEQTGLGTGIRYADIQALNLYWSQARILYQCFEANVRASDSSVFDHEMPGGQYTNLMVSQSDSCIDHEAHTTTVPSCPAWSWHSVVRNQEEVHRGQQACTYRMASSKNLLIMDPLKCGDIIKVCPGLPLLDSR